MSELDQPSENLTPAERSLKHVLEQAAQDSKNMPTQWEAVSDLAVSFTLKNRIYEADPRSKAEEDAQKELSEHEKRMSAKKMDKETGADYRATIRVFNNKVGLIEDEMRPGIEVEFAQSRLDTSQILVRRAENKFVQLYNQTVA